MDALLVDLIRRIVAALAALGLQSHAAQLDLAVTVPNVPAVILALRLAMGALKEEEALCTSTLSLIEAETWSQMQGRLCRADEASAWMLVCRRTVRATFLSDEGQEKAARVVIRHVLRIIAQIPLTARPPYVPLEVPWVRRIPDSLEVDAHAAEHPTPGGGGGGNWLISSRERDEAIVAELFVDEMGAVASWSHTDARGQRGALVSALPFAECRFLPLTAGLWPVFLLAPAAPIDPTGAPIEHIPTDKALDHVGWFKDVTPEGGEEQADSHGAALTAVVRERDHHAGRVAELIGDATWQRLRGRAFASLLGDLTCAGCAWTGTPHAAQLDKRGPLLCPACNLPALHAGDPTVVLAPLYETLGEAVSAAEKGPARAFITGTDQHGAHVEETVTIPEGALWHEVGRIAEALANVTTAADADGRGMRRAAVKAAQRADDTARADALAKRYLGDVEQVEGADGDTFFAELQAIAGFGGVMPPPPPFDSRRMVWACCGLVPCLCAAAWGLPVVSSGRDALAERIETDAAAADPHPLVCRHCEGPMTPEDIETRFCAVRDGDFCQPRPHPSHSFPTRQGHCLVCDVNIDAGDALVPCQVDIAEKDVAS